MEELIIRSLQGQTSREEDDRLLDWRAAGPEKERIYQEVLAVWTEMQDVEVKSAPPPVEEIVAGSASMRRRSLPGGRRAWWTWVPAAAAATALLAIAAGELSWRLFPQRAGSLDPIELVTNSGETLTTQLSDGTIVHLSSNSRLQVMPAPGKRQVRLEGRAFFGVARHDDWVFTVHSRVGEAEVLGTRFEFSTEGEAARVVVVDGRVGFEAAGQSIEATASQMIEAAVGGRPVLSDVEDLDTALDWMGTSLVFHDTPLRQAAREIETRYGTVVEITDPPLGRQTISGGFEEQSFDEVVRTICRVLSAECVIREGRAIISQAGDAGEAQ